VKLEMNASDTWAILSEAYVGEAMKKSRAFEWHKQFKEGRENVEHDKEVVKDLTEPMRMLQKYGIWCI
jgi:hypothetical protein